VKAWQKFVIAVLKIIMPVAGAAALAYFQYLQAVEMRKVQSRLEAAEKTIAAGVVGSPSNER
jgi:hypothetical protein